MITSVTTCTHLRVFPRFFLCYRLYFKNMPRERVTGEKNDLNVISTGTAAEAMDLELDSCIQHGHAIEVMGKTQKGVRVMVNGSKMAMVNSDGQFHNLTPPCRREKP